MSDYYQRLAALDLANDAYPDFASRRSRSHEKAVIISRLIAMHGFTHRRVLPSALNLSRSRMSSNVTNWIKMGFLKQLPVPGVGLIVGFDTLGARFARTELDLCVRSLSPSNVGREGARFEHSICVQLAMADAADRGNTTLARPGRCIAEAKIGYDDAVGGSHQIVADGLLGNTIIEVQLSRLSASELAKKIDVAAEVASDWGSTFYFYTSRPEVEYAARQRLQEYYGYTAGMFNIVPLPNS